MLCQAAKKHHDLESRKRLWFKYLTINGQWHRSYRTAQCCRAAPIGEEQLGFGKEPHKTDEIENSAKREGREEEVQGPLVAGRCLMCTLLLKVPKCEIFDPFFLTSINPIWVGDLRTGEEKIFFRRLLQIFAIFFFCASWACAKKLPTQTEPALKICLRRLSLR